MFISYNPNPDRKLVGDCVIRAITKVTDKTWDEIYMDICLQGFSMKDMPSSNAVWGAYLYSQGFQYLMSNGQMSQQQFGRLSQMAQAMGIKL